MNFDKALVGGNLTRNPELRYTASNTPVCDFGIAINRKWRDRDTGEQHEETVFLDCEAWGRNAENINKYFGKGRPIFIEGRHKLDQWKDKKTGANRSKVVITVESFEFCGGDRPESDLQPAPEITVKKKSPGDKHKALKDGDIPF